MLHNRKAMMDILDHPVMDDSDAFRDEMLQRIEFYFDRALRLLVTYKGNKAMAIDCFCLALGKTELTGLHTLPEISVKYFGGPEHKEAVGKVVRMFRDCLGIKGSPGQRNGEGRKNMAKARKTQLK